ncbi:MAG: hypothetical protein KF716_02840 [Anaerolineae bacterium]|nr:hypothetical protein [Anaerolineae bacterium]
MSQPPASDGYHDAAHHHALAHVFFTTTSRLHLLPTAFGNSDLRGRVLLSANCFKYFVQLSAIAVKSYFSPDFVAYCRYPRAVLKNDSLQEFLQILRKIH